MKKIHLRPPWIDLPLDVTVNILQKLGPEETLKSTQLVCATWWRVCKDPSTWSVIDMIDPADKDREISIFLANCLSNSCDKKDHRATMCYRTVDRSDLAIFLRSAVNRSNSGFKDLNNVSATMCCRAVDRSQGGLIDIRIGPFCTDSLLSYVSDRSSRLKRLTVASAVISGEGLMAAVQKWGELEELRLSYTQSITAQDIETIGICCPMLNTVAFNNTYGINDDDRALAIAKNMPNLRHLELKWNAFTEKGLQAILDGCPCLGSLDLREAIICGWEEGDFRKRCSWIKDLRLPSLFGFA